MARTASSARSSADDIILRIGGALAPVLRTLVRNTVREELLAAGDADPWIPHPRWPCASRRAACAFARSGELEGVRRVGEGRGALYLVRRSVLDAWIEAHALDAPDKPGLDDYEQEMAKRSLHPGLRPASHPPRPRSRDRQ